MVSLNGAYSAERGLGFITEAVRESHAVPAGAELNAGFEPHPWYRPGHGFSAGQASGFIPACVRVDVPESGNYRVTLAIENADGQRDAACYGDVEDTGLAARDVLVFVGDRQLVFRGTMPPDGSPLVVRTVVNVSDFVPRGYEQQGPQPVRFVALAVVGACARPASVDVEPAPEAPTVWIAGDSTVTDEGASYPYAPSDPYCGWGAMLPAWLDAGVAVSNHARAGLTSVTFRTGRHYEPVQAQWRPGDYLLVQFGHNDQKRPELDARGGYRRELKRYVDEARAAGVRPVLVTSLARNTWNADGSYHDLLHDWAESVKELGASEHVPVLDLHGLSMGLLQELGDEGARPMFHVGDRTHLHDVGAYRMAGFVAGELRRVLASWDESDGDGAAADPQSAQTRDLRALASHVTDGFGAWPLPQRAYALDRPQLVVDQYLHPLYLKYTAEPYITGDVSPFRKAMLLTPVEPAPSGAPRSLDVMLYVGPAVDPEPVVRAHRGLADALAAGHAVALVAYLPDQVRQRPDAPTVPDEAMAYLRANARRYGIDPDPVRVTLGGELPAQP